MIVHVNALDQSYPQEMEAFYRAVALGGPLESDSRLAANAVSTMYTAYLSAEKSGAEVRFELGPSLPAGGLGA